MPVDPGEAVPIDGVLKRCAMQGTLPPGGFTNNGNLWACLVRDYVPDLATPNVTPDAIPFNTNVLASYLTALPGVKCLMGQESSVINWPNVLSSTDDMAPKGDGVYNSSYVTLDGTGDYFETRYVPDWAVGFAGHTLEETFNGSGITIGCLMRVQSGDLASRVLLDWRNWGYGLGTGDQCGVLFIFTSAGYFDCWTRAASQFGSYLTNPPGDRFVTVEEDLRPYLADGNWHLFQFSRGTTNPPERTTLQVDDTLVYNGGTGNGIDLFTDFNLPVSIGQALTTTITGDPTFNNFKGDMALFWVRNRYTTPAEMALIAQAAEEASEGTFRNRSRNRLMMGVR